jgi:sulfur-oxidizing protein SoxA
VSPFSATKIEQHEMLQQAVRGESDPTGGDTMQHSALAVLLSLALSGIAGAGSSAAFAQSAVEEIAKYRQMLQEGNPADLWEARGEALWKTPRGPKQTSLEQCDLGLGAGVVKGAYAQLPRYFRDSGKVQDLESRLLSCMVELQGMSREQLIKNPFGGPGRQSDLEALGAYVAGESKGIKMNVSLAHPKEREAYRIGEKMFYFRAGPHDFACVTCHGEDNKRIRLQDLPNLLRPLDAQRAYTTWPAYRVSQGELRTMQHRLWDCFRQQRFPDVEYGSDTVAALTMFLAKNANGGIYNAPGLKR